LPAFFAALPWHRRQEPQWERRLVANSYCQERLQSAFGIGAESCPLWLGQCLDARPKSNVLFGFISGHFVPANVRFTPLLAVFTRRCSTTSRQNLVQLGKGAGEKLGFAKWPASGCVPSTPPLDCPLQGHSHRPRNNVLTRANTTDALLKIGR
jgi:hypothetical protein